MKGFVIAYLIASLAGCSYNDTTVSNTARQLEDPRVERIKKHRDAVVKFFSPMKVQEGDWLDSQPEQGETFEQYIESNPTLPTAQRNTIYVQPIGKFTREQQRAIELAAEYIRVFYNLPVQLRPGRPLGIVPKSLQRRLEYRNNLQIRTAYFLDIALPPLLPDDAAALIAFTNYDLYPGDTWHFVFGQASFDKRVGVWSLYQFAEPASRGNDPKLLISRTIKIAVHEVGHMFSMKHCIKYECLMSGTNHLLETDRRPLDTCPECMAKIAWAMNYDPERRYRALADFWNKQGWPAEERTMTEKAKAVAK